MLRAHRNLLSLGTQCVVYLVFLLKKKILSRVGRPPPPVGEGGVVGKERREPRGLREPSCTGAFKVQASPASLPV